MAGKMQTGHSIEGIMRWATGGRWADAWEETVAAHLGDALEDHGHALDDLPDLLGEEHFGNVMGGIFEDFLATTFDDRDPDNVVDDYLKRRGWKESAATRRYLAALRDSAIGLFEVGAIQSGEWFEVQDMLAGGASIRVYDKLCSQSVELGDRLALRLIQEREQVGMAGVTLVFDEEGCERLKEEIDALVEEAISTVQAIGGEATAEDPDFTQAVAREAILMQSAPLFTAIWLERTLESMADGDLPGLTTSEGDDLLICTVGLPLTGGDASEIARLLDASPDLERDDPDEPAWTWLGTYDPVVPGVDIGGREVTLASFREDGRGIMGSVRLLPDRVQLVALSEPRAEQGTAFLQDLLGERVGPPVTTTEDFDDLRARRLAGDAESAPALDLPQEEQDAIMGEFLDRHYRALIDQPIPVLDGQTLRQCAATRAGREKAAIWLEQAEDNERHRTSKSGGSAYDFGWMWTELGLKRTR